MITGELCVEVQWPPLGEDVKLCARRLSAQLLLLADTSSAFAQWIKSPGSFKAMKIAATKSRIDAKNLDELAALLLKGQNKTDFPPREVIPDLGFSTLLWNLNAKNIDAWLSVRCGIYSEKAGYNGVSLSIKTPSPKLLSVDRLLLLLKQTIDVWGANLGVIYHETHSSSEKRARIQLAYFVVPGANMNPIWRMEGVISDTYNGGTLFVDQKVRKVFEENEVWS